MTDPAAQTQRLPWELHPALEEARLRAVARVVRDVCHDSAADHQPDKGETVWSLGCVRYDRLRFSLRGAAELKEIWFAQVDEAGQVYNSWRIDLEPLTEVVPFKKAPVVPPAIVIKPRDEWKQQQNP